MPFSAFTYPAVIDRFGLTEASTDDLFAGVPAVPPTPTTAAILPMAVRLGTAAHSEAARSTWIVGNVLLDLWGRYAGQINLNAGPSFNPDPDAGLNGECDFLIGKAPQTSVVRAPVLVIFEAKRDSIPDGFGQCVAGMVGIQRFNRREGREVDPVYGCSTTGANWKFLALSGSTVTFDLTEYTITQVDRILGVLTHIVGPPPTLAAPRPAA